MKKGAKEVLMLKKAGMLLLVLLLVVFIAACGETDEEPEKEGTEGEVLEEEENSEKVTEEEPGEDGENSEENVAKDNPPDFLVEDLNFAWDAALDFEADDLIDLLLTEEEIHFLYEKEEGLYYQAYNMESGEEITKKKVEGAPMPGDFRHSSSIKLHKFNGGLFALIGQNERISKEDQEESGEEARDKQKMMVIDLKSNEILLSETPIIESYTMSEITVVSGTYLPGFIYDVTEDGRYLMILHSFKLLSIWENHLNYSQMQTEEELQEKNKEVLSQFEDAPLWVYDLKEEELMEIPYQDEIDVLAPYGVEGLKNGMNMIFTEQEGWLILDIEKQQVRKTGEGGAYRRRESEGPGIEQYREGTLFGENLFFTNVQLVAPDTGPLPNYNDLWSVEGDQLQYLGTFDLPIGDFIDESVYFNNHTEEIVVNRTELKNEAQDSNTSSDKEYVEKLYRLTFDEEKILANKEKGLIDPESFAVIDELEFPIGTFGEGNEQLSMMGMDGYMPLPIHDFAHLGYGTLAGSTIERKSSASFPFFYAYRNEDGAEKVLEIDGAALIEVTDTDLLIVKDDRLFNFSLEDFFQQLEE